MSPNEPKTPVIRTLPPIDVVFESDARPSDPGTLRVNADDLAALRRIALGVQQASDSKPPESRSMRAAKKTVGAGRYVAVITGSFALATEVLRLWHPEYVSVLGAAAEFVRQFLNAGG